jgi:hypothetical protein
MTTIGNELRRTVRGRVLAPGDEGFETARLPWNRSVDQRVRAVVEVEDAAGSGRRRPLPTPTCLGFRAAAEVSRSTPHDVGQIRRTRPRGQP